jgi:hypothetical protein
MGPEFLRVTIDFDQSHLFFPRIVTWVLVALVLFAVVARHRAFVRNWGGMCRDCAAAAKTFDVKRFGATLALLVVYAVAMDQLSYVWPNTGLSFLFCSMAFMAAMSLLYVHDLSRRKLLVIGLSSVLAPLVVWYALAKLFYLTLP